MYVDVYLPISIEKSFSYLVPDNLKKHIKEGQIVYVPFGNRTILGYINKINKKSIYKGQIKSIHKIASSAIADNGDIKNTIDWMNRYYLASKSTIIKNNFSHLLNKNFYLKNEIRKVAITKKGSDAINSKIIKGSSRIKIIEYLSLQKTYIDTKKLSKTSNSYNNSLKTLLRDQYVKIKLEEAKNDPLINICNNQNISKIKLSKKQDIIFQEIGSEIKNNFSVNLIHGVTGSGKTEIYIKLTERILDKGKSVLILVPEIALTPQTASRFKRYFGDSIGIWNSSMNLAEKRWTWNNIINGNIKVIIGTRSSVFLPMKNLSLIVIDEEHDSSYKESEKMPTYNARDIGIIRSKFIKSSVVLGSATPSLESYYNSINGKYNLFELKERYGKGLYPLIELVDMFKTSDGLNSFFSNQLIHSIKKCLLKNEQIILLHNRRGYATILYCNQCQYVFKSKKTSAPLTFHRSLNQLVCHHTQEKYNLPNQCPECQSNKLLFKGYGTERIEHEINKIFPNANIVRLDSDSTRLKDSHKNILNQFESGKADILIGTQMVSKGFDFHNVTLVGVINADLGLFLPDFRSGEKIFQLLYQVCGRTGRGEKKGKAIIQTFNQKDPFISCATMMDTKKYYNISLAERIKLKYPPFSKIIRLFLKGENIQILEKTMNQIADKLKQNNFEILGPAMAPIEKINNFYRIHIIIKSEKAFSFQDYWIKNLNFYKFISNIKGVKFRIDVDPVSLL